MSYSSLGHAAIRDHVKKAVFGREGRNIELVSGGVVEARSDGNYIESGYIYQERTHLHLDSGWHAQAGVWMIGPEACGLGIRADRRPILGNTSCFVPHLIEADSRRG